MKEQALVGGHLGKRSDTPASNGRIGHEEDGRGDDDSADLPHDTCRPPSIAVGLRASATIPTLDLVRVGD